MPVLWWLRQSHTEQMIIWLALGQRWCIIKIAGYGMRNTFTVNFTINIFQFYQLHQNLLKTTHLLAFSFAWTLLKLPNEEFSQDINAVCFVLKIFTSPKAAKYPNAILTIPIIVNTPRLDVSEFASVSSCAFCASRWVRFIDTQSNGFTIFCSLFIRQNV